MNFGDGGNASGQKSPVETASTSYLNVVLLCLDENALAQGAVSPRLIETLCWGASRWVDTYLMPEDVGGSGTAVGAFAKSQTTVLPTVQSNHSHTLRKTDTLFLQQKRTRACSGRTGRVFPRWVWWATARAGCGAGSRNSPTRRLSVRKGGVFTRWTLY